MTHLRHLFTAIIMLLALSSADAQTLKQHIEQIKQEKIEAQRNEKAKYDEACQKGTLEAYKEYEILYPTGLYINDIKSRIADFKLWEAAKNAHTADSYNKYIRTSKHRFFYNNAQKALKEINAEKDWNVIQHTRHISDLDNFILKYPESLYSEIAENKRHELKGVIYYKSNDYLEAYDEFIKAGGKYSLREENREIYDVCKEHYDYHSLGNNASEKDLKLFIAQYPNSSFSDNISNKLARSTIDNLYPYADNEHYETALSYAKDEATKEYVENRINQYNERYKETKKQEKNREKYEKELEENYYRQERSNNRRRKRLRYGNPVQFTLKVFDIAGNFCALDVKNGSSILAYANMGIGIKFGNNAYPIQLELTADPGMYAIRHAYNIHNRIYTGYNSYLDQLDYYEYFTDEEDYDFSERYFRLSFSSRLKINIINAQNCKFYIAATGCYNYKKDDTLEQDFSAGGGIGFAWRKADLFFYYKQDLDINKREVCSNDITNKYAGISLYLHF